VMPGQDSQSRSGFDSLPLIYHVDNRQEISAIGDRLSAMPFELGGENGVKAIAAMTPERVIGRGNTIPWKIPGEQKWFKEVTMGHCVLMGSKTYVSIGKPLPGRRNLVVSRNRTWEGVEMIRDLSQFNPDNYQGEIFVIGGAQIYRQLLDRCDELLITQLKAEYSGDIYFPEYKSKFRVVEQIRETPDYWIFRYARWDPLTERPDASDDHR
ncbi:MAG TPA: dihydrofolate reductase, partial [Chthoniobacterales bacterium]|nr:dihydrofolate reductase [Chthoniobacterales bacterium]